MTFVPFKRYSIKTNIPVNEVMMRLEEDIFPGGTGILNSNPDTIKTYRGTVKKDQFKIKRIATENWVIVTGKVFNSTVHTIIEIKMRPTFLPLVLFSFFLISLLFLTIGNLADMMNKHRFDAEIFQVLPGFAIAYLIPVLLINEEEKKFKEFMHGLLI